MTEAPKISVIVPTRNRSQFLPRLLEIYKSQTWENKELLILDDSDNEDHHFKELTKTNSDVHYWHQSKRATIGEKRNALASKSKGELIAHFDDDDYYAPNYLEWMQNGLTRSQSDLVKLAGWFALHEQTETLGYWNTLEQKLPHYVFSGLENPRLKQRTFTTRGYESFASGYGFSFFYKKNTWKLARFEDRDLGEDSAFTNKIKRLGLNVNYLQDNNGICLHVVHKGNTSKCFPNHLLPGFTKTLFFQEFFSQRTTNKQIPKARANMPMVSICTLTYNRKECVERLLKCIERQDYPLERIEWVILDDSSDYKESLAIRSHTGVTIKYQRIRQKLALGAKRNLSHRLCSGEYIVYMDDDDYYPPARVSHAVDSLTKSQCGIAGSTYLPIFFTHDETLWMSGPFGQNHATANTFAMTKEFAQSHSYNDLSTCNEEKEFLSNYTVPMVQLDPAKTAICISHEQNTFDKKRMRSNGETSRMKNISGAAGDFSFLREFCRSHQR